MPWTGELMVFREFQGILNASQSRSLIKPNLKYWKHFYAIAECGVRTRGQRVRASFSQRLLAVRAADSATDGKIVTIFFGANKVSCRSLSVNKTPRSLLLLGTADNGDDFMVDAAELLAISIEAGSDG